MYRRLRAKKRKAQLYFTFWIVILIVAICFSWAVVTCHGQAVDAQGFGWYKVKSIRQSQYQGVAGEVFSRSRRWDSGGSIGGITHETTHFLNSQIRNELGRKREQESAYLPGGYVLLIPRCGISLVSIAPQGRAGVALGYYWGDGRPVDAMSLIDEYSAYMCGSSVYPDGSRDRQFSVQNGRTIEGHLRRLREACRQRGYPYVHRLDELLAFGSAYFAKLERGMR
jgi:hypothetical protein